MASAPSWYGSCLSSCWVSPILPAQGTDLSLWHGPNPLLPWVGANRRRTMPSPAARVRSASSVPEFPCPEKQPIATVTRSASPPMQTIGTIGWNDLPNSVAQMRAMRPAISRRRRRLGGRFHRTTFPCPRHSSPALLGSSHRRRLSARAPSPISHWITQFSAHISDRGFWGGARGYARRRQAATRGRGRRCVPRAARSPIWVGSRLHPINQLRDLQKVPLANPYPLCD
jgi:hypothetical protein